MAALNCSCTFHSATSRIGYPQPAVAIGNTSAAKAKRDAQTLISWSASSSKADFRSKFRLSASSSLVGGQQGESEALAEENSSAVGLVVPRKAADVVQEFYDRINQRDYVGVASLFAEDCKYEDFNFSRPTTGKEEVLQFFEKVMSSFGTELKFVIDDMTRDDPNAVGVIWHLDWRGKAFPFSRGCSFYRCVVNSAGERQIRYCISSFHCRGLLHTTHRKSSERLDIWSALLSLLSLDSTRTGDDSNIASTSFFRVFLRFARDIVEPATKPGDVSMGALRLVTSLFERFPQLADRL